MPKKPHPADIADRAKVATATHFNVHRRLGPTEVFNQKAATLIEAIKIADELSADRRKPAMIYAITPDKMTVFVPKDMIDAARKESGADEAMKEAMTNTQIAQLTAILTGGGFKRANSKTAAEARFVNVAAEKGIDADKAADLLQGPFDFAEHILRERISGKPITINQVQSMRDANPEAFADIPPAHKIASANRAAELAHDGAATAGGKRAVILEAAQRGELPAAPDFSADTHKRFRPKLAKLIELAQAGDIDGLRAIEINPVSSSPKAMAKYRDLCVIALGAKGRTASA